MRSAILFRMTARSAGEVLPQAGAAACAASSAFSMSASVGARDLAERLPGDRRRVLEVLPAGRRHPLAADEVVVSRFEGHQRVGGARAGVDGHRVPPFDRDGVTRGHTTLAATMNSMAPEQRSHGETNPADPHLWLEDVTGDDALDWVRAHNEPDARRVSAGERFEQMRAEALEVLDTDARIPYVRRRGEYLLQLLARRGQPARAVAAHHAGQLPHASTPTGTCSSTSTSWRAPTTRTGCGRAPTSSSPTTRWPWSACPAAGRTPRSSASSTCATRTFVDRGFELPEAKTQIGWEDEDTVLVGTDFGPGSLTDSGYPRLVKRWRRGQPLDRRRDAVQRRAPTSASWWPHTTLAHRVSSAPCCAASVDFFNDEVYETARRRAHPASTPRPTPASRSHREWLLIELRTDWSIGGAEYPRRLPAGRRLRRIPLRHSATAGGVRTGRAHLPAPLRVDPRPVAARARWPTSRAACEIVTPGSWYRRTGARDSGEHQHRVVAADRDGDEIFLDSSGFDTPVAAAARHRGR